MPDWYPDPSRRFELRWFDGARWTEHVSNHGQQGLDPLTAVPPGYVWMPAVPYRPSPRNGWATAALVLGIAGACAAATMFLWLLAMPVAILAIVFGAIALRQSKADPRRIGRGFAIGGLVLGAIGTGLSIVGIFVTAALIDQLGEDLARSEGDWLISAVAVTDPVADPDVPPVRGSRYVAVEIRATNRDPVRAETAPGRFHLEDVDGRYFPRCSCAGAPDALVVPSGGVAPGESISGTVWFIVDDGMEPVILVWLPELFGFRETHVDLPR